MYFLEKNYLKLILIKRGHLIITIAFNKPDLIESQILLLKMHIKDSFVHVVFDNSSEASCSKKIKEICKLNKVIYFKNKGTEKNKKVQINPSISHGKALNYAFKKIAVPSGAKILTFLDHDIFPVKEYSFFSNIGSADFLGVKMSKMGMWYLWPGFFSMKMNKIINKKINFLPAPSLDTGGSLWSGIFSKEQKVIFARRRNYTIGKLTNKQKDVYQIVDSSWVHLVNGSNWANIKDMSKKEIFFKNIKGFERITNEK